MVSFPFKVLKGSFNLLFLGGWNVAQYFDNVIVFDTETETWAEAGAMKVPRGRPGASVVKPDDVKEYATDCVTKDIPSKYLQALIIISIHRNFFA